jgi:hypothetical protein
MGLPFQICDQVLGKMLGVENQYFISKYMVFYLWQISPKRQTGKCRFIVNQDTVLNIIPVDYVAKVIVNTLKGDDVEQLNIVNDKSFNMVKWIS